MQQTRKRKHEQGKELMKTHFATAEKAKSARKKRSNIAKAGKPEDIKNTEVEALLKPKRSC